MKTSKNLIALLNLILALLFLFASVVLIYIVNKNMRQQALVEAENKAQIILQRNLATHHFFGDLLKPHVFEALTLDLDEGYFDPVWMSSTFAVREMYNIFSEQFPLEYYYKEAAINARSPQNEADAFERDFIEQLNQDPELDSYSGIRLINEENYFVVLQKGETMAAECLPCHDTTERAPAGLVEIYGPEKSFGRYEGEVVSAVSIRIPLEEAYQQADLVSGKISGYLLVSLVVLFLLQYFLFSRWFVTPLRGIRNKAEQIAADADFLGDQIPMPSDRELGSMTKAFNKMSASLRKSRDELEGRLEELELFAYTISHNLRAPLRAISGLTAIIEDEVSSDLKAESREYFDRIQESSRKMDRLIDDLLHLTEVGLHSPDLSEVPISKLAQNVFSELAAEENDRQIEFNVDENLTVFGDEILIRILLFELLSNAIRFTDGKQPGMIDFGRMNIDGQPAYFIRDNGIGFEMEFAKGLFQPFTQLHPEFDTGTGMGLAIVNRIIQHHGGNIWVESQPDFGTTFYFTFDDE